MTGKKKQQTATAKKKKSALKPATTTTAKKKAKAKAKATTKARPSRAQRRALRTDEILTTALALVEEGGLAALTTAELARRNGAALGALYRFFPSRQAVVAALQAEALATLHADLEAARDVARALPLPRGPALWAPFIAMADVVFDEARRRPARFRLIDEVLSALDPVYDDDAAQRLERGVGAILGLMGGCVDDVVAASGHTGPRPDAGLARRFPLALWAGFHGVSHFQKRDRLVDDDHRAARVAGALLVLLLQGLGASAADVDAAFVAVAPRALLR